MRLPKVLLVIFGVFAVAATVLLQSQPVRATHQSYFIQPIYFRASDMPNNFSTYQAKMNSYMTEVGNWYSTAHLSSGDRPQITSVIARTGSQPKSWYCGSANPCTLGDVWGPLFNDMANSGSSAYPGYNPSTAKNVITVVFFDTIDGGGLGQARGFVSNYNPEGLGGTALVGKYVLTSGSIGTPGHDGTIAHEIGHALRLPHNMDNGQNFGNCALMGYNISSCWPNSTFLVSGSASDGRWYSEKDAVHWSPFTRPNGSTSPASNLSVSQGGCGTATLSWTPVSGDGVTQQVLIVALRGSRLSVNGTLIRVDKVFFLETPHVYYLSATATSFGLLSLPPGNYHWEVAAVNASGHVHSWPTASGFTKTC